MVQLLISEICFAGCENTHSDGTPAQMFTDKLIHFIQLYIIYTVYSWCVCSHSLSSFLALWLSPRGLQTDQTDLGKCKNTTKNIYV